MKAPRKIGKNIFLIGGSNSPEFSEEIYSVFFGSEKEARKKAKKELKRKRFRHVNV